MQGNVLGIYERVQSDDDMNFFLREQHLYGSNRLGIIKRDIKLHNRFGMYLFSNFANNKFTYTYGSKNYELTNHLGNVLTVVNDKKIPKGDSNNTPINYYVADVVSATDYYPGGMMMPKRSFNSDVYRAGFNGKENDNEVAGMGNWQDYGERVYNPRLLRFPSPDPLIVKKQQYPELSSYQFASNSPIVGIDQDGLEFVHYKVINQNEFGQLHVANSNEVEHSTWIHSIVAKLGGDIEPFKVHVLDFNGRGYLFSDLNSLLKANVKDLQGRPTLEGVESIQAATGVLASFTALKVPATSNAVIETISKGIEDVSQLTNERNKSNEILDSKKNLPTVKSEKSETAKQFSLEIKNTAAERDNTEISNKTIQDKAVPISSNLTPVEKK